ncbi:excalibur calcium-binding domain-containing protein [Streptomyces sp. TRM70308]|uniref:excalibur calcium-binding domain-containing protein n=1 Tax=Streptomyces sp. TRM70308 TaxID=3131932 RepID=UPI003CFC6128
MRHIRRPAAVLLSACALGLLPTAAAAHDGAHPFENCTAAYEAGYADIPAGDPHYGEHLDRDRDGTGCDQPPAGFVPADDTDDASGGTTDDAASPGPDSSAPASAPGGGTERDASELAETGGDDTTPYLAGAGGAVLLAGAAVLFTVRRRRAER